MKKAHYIYCILSLIYILGAHNGYIALWRGDDPEPQRVFPFRISSLPPADQDALKKGIRIETELDLIKRMEDYLS